MKQPQISIIIPTYNDPNGISTTVKSLINQDFKQNYEIIVVDNNSQDNTREVVKKIIELNTNQYCQLSLYNQDKIQTSYATRNMGIKKAKGEVLCFIDSDMWVDNDYLSKVLKAYTNRKEECFYMGCRVEIVMKEGNIYEKYNKFFGFPVKENLLKAHYIYTACLIINKQLITKIGYFNRSLFSGGDWEFGQRVFCSGIHQVYSHNIILYHPARDNLKLLINKYRRIGRGLCQNRLYRYYFLLILLPKNPWIFYRSIKSKYPQERFINIFWLYLIDIFIRKFSIVRGYTLQLFLEPSIIHLTL